MATTVKLQYWPVLSRDTDTDGKLKRGGYKRTALALQEREEKLVRLETERAPFSPGAVTRRTSPSSA